MMKDVLLNKLNSCKGSILILMFTICTCLSTFAQTRQITGKVTSTEDGSGMPGVSVRVKGTSTGTTTDVNGVYKISAANGTVLSFSFIGYATSEVTVGDGSTYNVKLTADARNLVEVNVVSTGYGSSKRKDLTGSISSVNAEQIAKVPVTTLDQAIQGRSAGVQVINNDGSPGGSVQIQIRGIGSLGNNQPLYVVDGYPTQSISNLNPSDIATIDILKDASATAIYGERASNGVVILTTKRGGKGNPQVSLDATDAFQARPKTYKVLDAQTWATVAAAHGAANVDNYGVLPEWNNPSSLTEADWQKAVYRTGLLQNYNLAVRGGSDKIQSSFSGGYVDQKGIVLGSQYKRLNLGTNLDYNVAGWLKSSTSVKFSRIDSKIPFGTGGQGAGSGIGYLSKLPPTVSGNKLTSQIEDANGNYGFFNPTNASPVRNWGSGPVYAINTNEQKNLTNYFLGTSSLEATIYHDFKIKTNFGINTNESNGYNFNPSDTRALAQYGLGTQTSQNNYSQYANSNYEWLWENTIAYNKTFGKHNIDFVGGVSEQSDIYRFITASGNNLPNDQLRALDFLTQPLNNISGYSTPSALASQFARLNYKFDDKYYITGTVRRDGSTKFGPGLKYGTFPSGSVAWRAKSEDFLKNVDLISDLKFRASYGEIGSQFNIGEFGYLTQYTPGPVATNGGNNGYTFGKNGGAPGTYQPGLVLTGLPNPKLKWETSDQTDIGMDISFLKGDLTFTVDYYDKKSRDFLLNIPVPAQTGFTSAQRNVGSIDNKGFEFAVNYGHTVNDFHYNVGLNITTVKNTLTSLATGQNSIDNLGSLGFSTTGTNNWGIYSRSYVGGPVGEFYGYKTAGIFQTQDEINTLDAASQAKNGPGNNYQTNGGPLKTAVPGDRKYVDINHDGRITPDDQTALGSPIPKFYGGLTFDATYKAFDISLFFYGVYGNKIFNYQERTLESLITTTGSVGIQNMGQVYYDNAWTSQNHSERYAVITGNDYNSNTRPADIYVENGSYLRLRTMTLGYTLPPSISKKLSITKLRIFVTGQNLFTITSYKGLDPEIGIPTDSNGNRLPTAAGVDVGTYPSSRFFTAGLNVTF